MVKTWHKWALGIVVMGSVAYGLLSFFRGRVSSEEMNDIRYEWKEQAVYTYQLEMSQEGWTSFDQAWQSLDGQKATRIPFQFRWTTAEAEFTILRSDAQGSDFSVVFPDAKVELRYGSSDPGLGEATRKALAEPSFFHLSERGQVGDIEFPKGATTISRNLIREFLVQAFPRLQVGSFMEPYKNGQRTVEQKARRMEGLELARKFRGFKGSDTFRRQFQAKLEGRGRYRFAKDEMSLRNIELLSHYKIFQSQGQIQDETTGLHLTWLRKSIVPQDRVQAILALKGNGVRASLDGREEFAKAQRDALEKKIAGHTFEKELEDFLNLGSKVEMVQAYHNFDRLLAFLTLFPERADEVLLQMREYPGSDSRLDILAAALVKTQDVAVHMKLIDFMIARPEEADVWRQVLFNFALQEGLSPQVLDRVSALLDQADSRSDIHRTLVENIGSIAYQTPDGDRQKSVYNKLVLRAAETTDEASLLPYVTGLGNLGYSDTTSWAQEALKSANPEVRRLAPQTLRRLESPEAGYILIDLVAHDKDKRVRQEASQALMDKEYEASQFEDLGRMLTSETDPQVALRLVDVLGHSQEHKERAIEILENYFRKCGDPQVCQRVESLLVAKRSSQDSGANP